MKRLFAIVLFCFLVPHVYAETINYDNGDKYVGEVSNGVPHGYGTSTFLNGDEYIGEFKDGKRHGHGTYTSPNGPKYIGEWKDNVQWNGIQYGPDDNISAKIVEGVWDIPTGACLRERRYAEDSKNMIDCEFPDGGRYVGEIGNEDWNGEGTFFFPDGSRFIGGWKDGLPHGQGMYTWQDGEKLSAEFRYGRAQGHGSYEWANGAKYVGEFKDDVSWNGTLYDADGTVRGTYSNGEWIAN